MTGSEWSLSLHLGYSKQAEGRHGYGFCERLRIEGTATFALDFPPNIICQWNFTNRTAAAQRIQNKDSVLTSCSTSFLVILDQAVCLYLYADDTLLYNGVILWGYLCGSVQPTQDPRYGHFPYLHHPSEKTQWQRP